MSDLISRSALLEAGSAKKINEAVEGWNELPSNAKAACIRLARENKKLVMAAPAVDAVEVVRCKDCKHWHEDTGWCYHHSHFITPDGEACHPWESANWKMFDDEDYCSYGERRADDGRSKAD